MTAKSFGRSAFVVEVLAAAISAPVCDANTAIDSILSGMGTFSGVDRAYVFQRKAGDLLDNTHEWCGPRIAPMIDMLQDMSMDIIAPWREGFERGEILHVPSVDAMDLDASIRELLRMQAIRGILLVPLQYDGQIVGFVGFDRVKSAGAFAPEVVRILTAIAGAVGTILARAAANREIMRVQTELESSVQKLHLLAMNDHLTGAPNRRAFHLAMTERLAIGDRQQTQTCIAMIDLLRFKSVNETHGHVIGDMILKTIVDRWDVIRTADAELFRVGGDEFAVVLQGRDAESEMASVIATMRRVLVAPFFPGDQNIRIDISVGITLAPRDGQTVDSMSSNADLALLASKIEKGANRIYSPVLRNLATQRHKTVQDLLAAKVDEDFILAYQPIIELHSGDIVKVEVLLRWLHPKRGILMPVDFIDVLCGLNQSRAIGQWVLETACRVVADWNRRFSMDLVASINAFPLQIASVDFVDDVQLALEKSGLPVRSLEIEVTENIAMEERSLNRKTLQQLSDMSVAIALDDFGTGFASLNSLTQVDIQTLKIDRSFVVNLRDNDPRIEVLKAMQLMTKGLRIRSIVEGIEDQGVADIIRRLGFDCGQGYYWSRPVDAETFATLLAPNAMAKRKLS